MQFPQGSIRVDVGYYSQKDQENLLRYPTAEGVRRVVATPLEIPTAEFLSYYLFHRKRLGTGDYRDLQRIKDRLDSAIAQLDGCVRWNGISLVRPREATGSLHEVSEHLGEAVGLAVVRRIHDLELTEADWALIPENSGPTAIPSLDFSFASDGRQLIEVETKGSTVHDNRMKPSAVHQHRSSIRRKKSGLERVETTSQMGPKPLRYGTIVALDGREDGILRCWLTDPPAEETLLLPRAVRLLRRLAFLESWLRLVHPRSDLAVAVTNRNAALRALQDPFQLDGVRLLMRDGRTFAGDGEFEELNFFGTRSRVVDGSAGGRVLVLNSKRLAFLGIRADLVELSYEQDFEHLLRWNFEPGSLEKTVEVVMTERQVKNSVLPSRIKDLASDRGYARFELSGQLHYSPAGLVFGVLEIPS